MKKHVRYFIIVLLIFVNVPCVKAYRNQIIGIDQSTLPKENTAGLINNRLSLQVNDGYQADELLASNLASIEVSKLHLSTLNHYIGGLASVSKIRLYITDGKISSEPKVSISVDSRQDVTYYAVDCQINEDEHGAYYEISISGNYLSHAYQVEFLEKINLKSIEVFGKVFNENIFQDAIIKQDGKLIDAYSMLDQTIKTDITLPTHTELEIIAPKGRGYLISQLIFASNFSSDQGARSIQLSYRDLNTREWVNLESADAIYTEEQDQRRQLWTVELPDIYTNHIKVNIVFNDKWGKGILTELNAIGVQRIDAISLADIIDHVDKVSPSTTVLSLNWLRDYGLSLEDYSVKLKTTSDASVISLDQHVYHSTVDQTVSVVYEISDASGTQVESPMIQVQVPREDTSKTYVDLVSDRTSFIKNPATGWVAYVEGFESSVYNLYGKTVHNPNARNKGLSLQIDTAVEAKEYWRQIDELTQEGMPISILYIRQPWSWFEPLEGQYAWKDSDSALYGLVEGARQRGIQLAFRVLTNSASGGRQATPQFVFDAGARSKYVDAGAYIGKTNEPYLDDSIFVEKFDSFIKAFADEYDNEGTAFIDAHGHGEWGEMNNGMYISFLSNMNRTVAVLQNIYEKHFGNVLLGGQLMSLKGQDTIQESFNPNGANFVMRRDAFGSSVYLDPHRKVIQYLRGEGIPLFAENCYHHFQSRDFRWSVAIDLPEGGGRNEYSGDDPFYTMRAMMKKVVDDAIDLRANTLDLRTLEDCKLFTYYGKSLLDYFNREGGYRISLQDLSFTPYEENQPVIIESTWTNYGEGIVPNKNKRWGNKIKITFALIDENDEVIYKDIVGTDEINIGDFEKGHMYKNIHLLDIDSAVKKGQYRLAVALTNEKMDYLPYIKLANRDKETPNGWLVLGDINIP
ncbi:hypothetical protein ABID29_001509 [Streptococcus rupicaprae]|uniref:DUF4832 domain-containing protein n=1 Tax=Streptococcus rupicaprae TaxID=759619 RepID=A0ABV2FIJ9_9STRE